MNILSGSKCIPLSIRFDVTVVFRFDSFDGLVIVYDYSVLLSSLETRTRTTQESRFFLLRNNKTNSCNFFAFCCFSSCTLLHNRGEPASIQRHVGVHFIPLIALHHAALDGVRPYVRHHTAQTCTLRHTLMMHILCCAQPTACKVDPRDRSIPHHNGAHTHTHTRTHTARTLFHQQNAHPDQQSPVQRVRHVSRVLRDATSLWTKCATSEPRQVEKSRKSVVVVVVVV